jgi:hypothetical protein
MPFLLRRLDHPVILIPRKRGRWVIRKNLFKRLWCLVFGRRGYFRDMVYGEIFNSPPKIENQGFPGFFTIA